MIKSLLLKVFLIAWILVIGCVVLMAIATLVNDPSGIFIWSVFLPLPVILMVATLWFLMDTRRLNGFARAAYFFLSMLYSVIYWRMFFGTLVVGRRSEGNITFAQEPWRLMEVYHNMFVMIDSRSSLTACFELIMIPLSLLLPVVALVSVYQISRQILRRFAETSAQP